MNLFKRLGDHVGDAGAGDEKAKPEGHKRAYSVESNNCE